MRSDFIAAPEDRILITGAAGFIGLRVVAELLRQGFRNLICFTRPSGRSEALAEAAKKASGARMEVFTGNLLSVEDCRKACAGAKVILHLAAGTRDKSHPDAFMNSVVATRNLVEAAIQGGDLRRIVLVSSFAVYSNRQRSRVLKEDSPLQENPERGCDAYCYAKMRQEELVKAYGADGSLPYVILRPGSVYGPGKKDITGRVGLGTFGLFLHLGGGNRIPFTYVDNCAQAIVLAGMIPTVDGEVFNVLDDDLPSSRAFLKLYKTHVRRFHSIYIPHVLSYGLCYLWERYSVWSDGQLPPAYTRRQWYSQWRRTHYSNAKLKALLGWVPRVSMAEGLRRTFALTDTGGEHA